MSILSSCFTYKVNMPIKLEINVREDDVTLKVVVLQSPNNHIRYTGVSTARALDLFFVNSVTGDISVRRAITDDQSVNNNLYTVRTRHSHTRGDLTTCIAYSNTVTLHV